MTFLVSGLGFSSGFWV